MDIDRSGYRSRLAELEALAREIPNSRMAAIAKITALAVMNMRWESVMVDRELSEHPFPLVEQFIEDAAGQIAAWRGALFIEADAKPVDREPAPMEATHQELFQSLWVNFSPDEYLDRIARYDHRLRINGLSDGFLDGARCIDMGSGHGNFAHALRNAGAAKVLGIDYGSASVAFAKAAAQRLGATGIEFRVGTVYAVDEPDESFDFAVQNGVFHHLDDEDAAYAEALRLLKPGGWMWIYTDGCDAVGQDLWAASVRVLSDVPAALVLEVLDFLEVETGKRYHLGDGLNATYRHTSWNALTERLAALGFGEFRRLTGGYPTDFDLDVIEADPWGREKFGDGDLRLLARKL